MATSTRSKKITPAFKSRAVEMVLSDQDVGKVACKLGIPEDRLIIWKLQSLMVRLRRLIAAVKRYQTRPHRDEAGARLLIQNACPLLIETGYFHDTLSTLFWSRKPMLSQTIALLRQMASWQPSAASPGRRGSRSASRGPARSGGG